MNLPGLTKLSGLIGATLLLSSCVITPKSSLQLDELGGCPPFPNCVSTQSVSPIHKLAEYQMTQPAEDAWPEVVTAVETLPNTVIKKQDNYYLFAKSYSEFFKFVDYVEVYAKPGSDLLQVRSSSMLGFSDLGVNRNRAERFRVLLGEAGVLQ